MRVKHSVHCNAKLERMLPARKNPLLNKLVYACLLKPGLRTAFSRVNVRQAAPPPNDGLPVVLVVNHCAWWDGHLMMALNEERTDWRRAGFVMVEEAQLVRYGFMRWVGGFSVNRQDGRSALASLRYAADVLAQQPNRVLLMFPQGEIKANDMRPLEFFGGVGRLVKDVTERVGTCAAFPVALRYEFLGEQKPEAFISVGAPLIYLRSESWHAKQITHALQTALTTELDRLRDDVVAYRLESFEILLAGTVSINRWWDALRRREPISVVGRR
jgi:hypothetical protein